MGKKENNIPVSGMSIAHPMNIKENQYPLMLNGNIQTDISGAVTLTNEHSNILCNRFPTGFKVIGELFVPEEQVTYVWLVNPLSNESQIGYISEYTYIEFTDPSLADPCDNCGTVNIENEPLEKQTQEPTCVYTCITTSTCLNFSIDFPIRRPVFKKDNCGSTLYFTDFHNPVRSLKLNLDKQIDDSQRTIIGYTGDCVDIDGNPVECDTLNSDCQCIGHGTYTCTCCQPVYQDRCTDTDIDCIKLRLFPQIPHICIEPESVVLGGVLRAGTYQLAACYADSNGERATRTFSVSNPISVFDPNQTVTTQLDYLTGLGVKFLINDLVSAQYQYIDIFIVGTINNVSSVKKVETVDITSLVNGTLEYVVSDFEKGEDVSIDDIMQVFPVYELAQEITSAGNTLLLGNLVGPRDLNLQRAVNGISSSIRWVSSEANEWFYNDGANDANYRGYLRDEVYALGLVFERNNTLDTCAYPLIGRDINTAFTPLESDPTCSSWGLNIPGFTSVPGAALFFYTGQWIATKNYYTRDTANNIPYDIVIFNGIYYLARTNNIGSQPDTNPGDWLDTSTTPTPNFLTTDGCSLCVVDDEVISNPDVFIPPGCVHDKNQIPDPHDLRWQVYNTACNAGKICNPEEAKVVCIDDTETIKCHSFRYTVPTASATWAAHGAGVATLDLTVDPTTLGIFVGATILSSGGGLPANTTLAGIGPGNSITVNISGAILIQTDPVTLSFDIDCSDILCAIDASCNPGDCYIDQTNQCLPCSGNYPTLISDVAHCTSAWDHTVTYDPSGGEEVSYLGITYISVAIAGNLNKTPPNATYWTVVGPTVGNVCPCPTWPLHIVNPCKTDYVRTRSDAEAYYNGIDPTTGQPRHSYLLCIDATLVTYSDLLADPYVVKTSSTPVKILDASTKPWYIYDITGASNPPTAGSIAGLTIDPSDPTKNFQSGTKGPEDPVCLNGMFNWPSVAQPVQNYLFPAVNIPDTQPENYDPNNGIGSFNPSPENKCNDYGPTAPLMYTLGENITAPAAHPCLCTDCAWLADYWGMGIALNVPAGEVNNTKYQSYWYSFTATALQPTIIIKSKIAYKFGQFTTAVPAHFPDTVTAGLKDYQEQGDIRIDVYEGDFNLVNPTYSTGVDTVNPATYCYLNGSPEQDQGVLIIGDVANSSGQVGLNGPSGQLPLIPGTTYYVHIYLLVQGRNKINKAPLFNVNKTGNCVCYDCTTCTCPPGASCCPCWFANYGYLNLCMNSATSPNTKVVSLPETWEVECEYTLYFRHNKLIDHGCLLQTYEYGPFAYWKSDTRKYPNNPDVWGDMCQQPIRHFKFPDCLVSKLQDQDPLIPHDSSGAVVSDGPFNSQRKAKVYPLGFRIDPEDIKAWLKWAASKDSNPGGDPLISAEELASITGYKLVRGNRVGNKSIAAKGLLYDMWKYNEYDYINKSFSNIKTYYASYPFNDLNSDPYLNRSGSNITHPFSGVSNNRFAFLSPETTFDSPFIGYELKFESTVFGDALGNFYTVKNHPKYTLLSEGGIALAATLAGIQLAGDLLVALGTLLGQFTVGFSDTIPVGSIVGFVGEFLDIAPHFFIYAKQWRDIILNFGVPKNFTKYYAAVGNYHSSGLLGEVPNLGEKRRLISNGTYLLAGNLGTSDDGVLSKINNYEREDSVYMYLNAKILYAGTVLANPFFSDSSRFIMSGGSDNRPCSLIDRQSNVASYYSSMKYDVPDQYGDIHDIEWLYTGTCERLDFNKDQSDIVCNPVFGGDTFIGRMSQKRKLPFFLDNPVGADTSIDFQYWHLSNISNATYYFNSVGESVASSSSIQFKPVEHNFDCETTGGLYLNGSIYLFSYGIASFICESAYNLNFRYAEDNKFRDFYPHQSDIENWTQEYRIPIETPNAYLYNKTYSKQNKENFFCTQPVIYSNAQCVTTYRNRLINSIPDKDNDFYSDPWRIFLGADQADFPLINGQLMGLNGIEREKVLVIFDKTYLVFNAYYTIDTNAGSAQIGTGSMFSQKPEEYAKTDLGYSGTQHHAFTSTQFGHFWIDARRSSVFMLPPGGSVEEISDSYETFFNNNLPFFILKAFPNYPVDNNYKYIGLALGWDNRFNRLFITKRDYELKPLWQKHDRISNYVIYSGETGLVNPCGDDNPTQLDPDSFYLVILDSPCRFIKVELTDSTYFCNKSWTIAYSPTTKSWISFYSFIPNYYISHENYFQTGINYSQSPDILEEGLWNHLITNKSYQVFYGKLNPYITDVIIKEQLINKQLNSIEYQADFLRFQNDYDYFYNPGVTFNKMVIWSENRNTGNLELVPQAPNDMSQALVYPRTNPDSTTVLVTRKENNWRVNQFWDLVRNKNSNVPPMLYDCHPYLKHVNPLAIWYNKPTFQRSRLTQDYFTLRLINDKYSNYKIINKWFLEDTMQSYS